MYHPKAQDQPFTDLNNRSADMVLISCPTKNVDYPGLALPVLVGALRTADRACLVIDLNAETRNQLMSEKTLIHLRNIVLPSLAKTLFSHPVMQNNAVLLLNWLKSLEESDITVADIARARDKMLSREYKSLLSSAEEFEACLSVFHISRCLHNIFDLYVSCPWMFSVHGIEDPIEQAISRALACIAKAQPVLIGLSVLDIQRVFSMYMAKRIHDEFSIPIVIGGADATKFPASYLNYYPYIDYVLVREAEETLPMLLGMMPRRADIVKFVPNVYYRNGSSISHSQLRYQSPQTITSPDFSALPLHLYLIPALPVQASRGCAWAKCKFCVHWQTYSQRIDRPAMDVVRDIQEAHDKYGVCLFHFTDDELNVELGSEIASELPSKCPNVRWLSYARFSAKFSRSVFNLWYAGGCRIIEWGFESASQRILDAMNKGTKFDIAMRNIKDAASAGIMNKLFAFHGYPTETATDLAHTLSILSDLAQKGQVRFFFPVRNRFELLWGSQAFDEALCDDSFCGRIRIPRGKFSIRAESAVESSEEQQKVTWLHTFLNEMRQLQKDCRVYSVDDENVTLDLLVVNLLEKGLEVAYTCKRSPGCGGNGD